MEIFKVICVVTLMVYLVAGQPCLEWWEKCCDKYV